LTPRNSASTSAPGTNSTPTPMTTASITPTHSTIQSTPHTFSHHSHSHSTE
jgi:hypothetical protein